MQTHKLAAADLMQKSATNGSSTINFNVFINKQQTQQQLQT